jgi:hypothetical protein
VQLRSRAPAPQEVAEPALRATHASEYQPWVSTPLLDAVGHGVALLDKRKEPGELLPFWPYDRERLSRIYQGHYQDAA